VGIFLGKTMNYGKTKTGKKGAGKKGAGKK
jgi:hypothetical protein